MDRHPIRAKRLVANRGERNRYSRIPRNQPCYSDGSSNPSLPFTLSPSLTVHPSTNNRSNTMVDTDTDDARYPPDFVILIRERTMSHNIRYGWIRRAGISHKHANSFQSKQLGRIRKKIIGGNPNVARRFTVMTRQTGFPPVDSERASKSYPVLPLLLFKKKREKEIRSIGGKKREERRGARSNKQLGRKDASFLSDPHKARSRCSTDSTTEGSEQNPIDRRAEKEAAL